jgi:hypothetical protein
VSSLNIPASMDLALQSLRWVHNERYPDALFVSGLIEDTNQLLRLRSKEIGRFCCGVGAIPGPVVGARTRWRFAWHSSPKAKYCYVVFVSAYARTGTTNLDPYAKLKIMSGVSTLVGTCEYHSGAGAVSPVPPDTPAYFSISYNILNDGVAAVTIPADTELHGFVEDNYSRIVAAVVYEVSAESDTANGYVEHAHAVHSPIVDGTRQDLTTALRTQWKRGAAHLWNWCVDDETTPRTRTANTYLNLIDSASTDMTSAGVVSAKLDLANCSTLRRGTVPCRLRVNAKMSSGTGTVRLMRGSDNTTITTININSATQGWFDADINLVANQDTYSLFFASDGTHTLTVYAASLYQYEA